MKFLLSSAAVLPFLIAVLPSAVEAQFMQFVRISSETTYFESTRANTLTLGVLIGGTLGESISGSNACVSGCDNKFCSNDGVICAKVLENCDGNSHFNIYYANTCRRFTLNQGSECGSDPDAADGKQSWKDTYIPWQDFDFQSGDACL
ncbi:hypothetical protein BGZ99_009802 [Dissophora globulifera]|uniref:Uncharacterized protein n=1 Tax=Dissophora globulifera TaxID=979702 RepID=A0A9P6RV10_9FUNG|nr:hypothetical protein BGZ99_009802 [Dissophora globulifera]